MKMFEIQDTVNLSPIASAPISGSTYISGLNSGEIFAIRPSEILALKFNSESPNFLQSVAQTPAAKSPTAVEASAKAEVVLSAHFFENQLAARAFDGTRFLDAQTFECGWAHQFRPHPNGRWAYGACMKDTMMQFDIDHDARRVVPMKTSKFTLGGGPRHMAFHPEGQVLYVMLQMSSEIAVLDIDQNTGALIQPPRQIISTTPGSEAQKTSDLQITPNGKWLYGFNRNSQTMATFSVSADGALELSGNTAMPYGEVRHFALSKNGGFLVTATNKGHVGLWKINESTGALLLTSETQGVGNATSVFLIE